MGVDAPEPGVRETVVDALKFVYPTIRVQPVQVTPELAAYAFLLARALDSSARVTYGAFSFYAAVVNGTLTRSWKDVPKDVVDGVRAALEDSDPQRNMIASAFIHYKFPERLVQKYIDEPDPDNPVKTLPEIRVDPSSELDKWVFRL